MVDAENGLKRDKLHEQAARWLQEGIVSGRYPVGSVLPSERELADQLGVSLTTIRYAVRMLVARGLVEVRQGLGATVTQDGRQSFVEILDLLLKRNSYEFGDLAEFRDMLEPAAAALAAERATLEDLTRLKQALDRFCDAVGNCEIDEVQALHAEFHVAIVMCAGNPVLSDFLVPIVRVAARITGLFDEGPIGSAAGEKLSHSAIYECIAGRDRACAHDLLKVHQQPLIEQISAVHRLHNCGARCGGQAAS
jgi:DNA-binding FadR family transcriptional regulator